MSPQANNMEAIINMTEERRKTLRRESDQRLWAEVQHLRESAKDSRADKETRSKRRRAIRRNCTVGIALILEHQYGNNDTWNVEEHPIKGKLLDLSHDGASLFTGQQLDIGQPLSLRIAIDRKSPIAAQAIVRWSKSIPEKHGYASGVQFSTMEEKDRKRLIKFLQAMDATVGL